MERLRAAYGKPLVLVHTEWTPAVPALSCDIKVPADARERFARLEEFHGICPVGRLRRMEDE